MSEKIGQLILPMIHCTITKNGVFLNDELFIGVDANSENHLKSMYQALNWEYPKFHKMDKLSKLSVIGIKSLCTLTNNFSAYGDDDIALLFANSSSSIDTDIKFLQSVQEIGNPSPSLFVYTLPNILTGELAIAHKWFGENTFFITEKFNPTLFINQIKRYFRAGNKAVVCGWVEVNAKEEEAFFFFVESEDHIPTIETLETLFLKLTLT